MHRAVHFHDEHGLCGQKVRHMLSANDDLTTELDA
jgi:hypothetical protein